MLGNNLSKERFETVVSIIKRAEKIGLLKNEIISHEIDIETAYKVFGIDLEKWLNADDENFIHDFVGIYNNINREKVANYISGKTEKIDADAFNFFVPRFARK